MFSVFGTSAAKAPSAPAVPDDVLPDYFPRAPKECKAEAEIFFTCFTEKSVKTSDTDTEAGIRGLQECLNLKKSYESCMGKLDSSKLDRRYEVNEEYRRKSK